MFNDKKKLRSFIVMTVLLLAIIANGFFTLGSFKNNPSSAWLSQPAGNAGGVYFDDYVVLEVLQQDVNGKELSIKNSEGSTEFYAHINVGKIFADNTEKGMGVVELQWKSTTDFPTEVSSNKHVVKINKGVDTENGQSQYSWQSVKLTSYYKYCCVRTKDLLEVNEIVFTNSDGEVLSARVVGANVWKELSSGSVSEQYVNVESFETENTALNLANEQSLFKKYSSMAKKYNFTSEEAGVVNAALSLFNSDSKFIASDVGALGVELVAIGLAVFGVNTLGARIIPYIFFVLTVVLLFSLFSSLFNDSDMGLLGAVFGVLSGLGLSLAGVGSINIIYVFFALLALHFAVLFYKKVNDYILSSKGMITEKRNAIYLPILVSALAFALAVAVDFKALFILPALIVVFVLGLLKAKKVYAYNNSIAKFEDEKVKNVAQYKVNTIGSVVVMVASFIILPMLFVLFGYSILGSSYTEAYGSNNVISAIFDHFNATIFGSGSEKSEFVKWIVGAGNTLVYGSKTDTTFAEVYVINNIATQIILLTSAIFTTVYFICKVAKNKEYLSNKNGTAQYLPAYFILVIAAIVSWLLFAFVKGANNADYILSLLVMIGFIPLTFKLLKDMNITLFKIKGRDVSLANMYLIVAIALSLIFFAVGYVAFAGMEISLTAAKILFTWWI